MTTRLTFPKPPSPSLSSLSERGGEFLEVIVENFCFLLGLTFISPVVHGRVLQGINVRGEDHRIELN